jgi:hypothetical protein
MRLKTQRRTIYVAMGLTALALTGGFALASLSLGGTANTSYQGSHTTMVSAVPGLSWTETELTETGGVTNTSGCATLPGCNVSAAAATVCAGSTQSGTWCASSDFVEQVVLTTSSSQAFPGYAVNVTIFVVESGNTLTGETFHFTDGATNDVETLTIDFDIGTTSGGPAAVSSVTVIATA